MHKDQNKQTLIYFFFLIVKHPPPPPIYLYMPIPLGKKIKSRMTRIAPVLYTGLIFYKALYCQRTTGMSGSNDQPWPPTQILGCVSPLSKIWLWLSQLPSLQDQVLMWIFEGDQVCGSMSLSPCSLSQTHKAQFSPASTKLCGLWLAFFHTVLAILKS